MKTKLLSLIAALCVATGIFAYKFESDGLYYRITSDTIPYTVAVTFEFNDYDNYVGLIRAVIPETVTYDGITYAVTSIGYGAFRYTGLTSITIPNSVGSIGDYAFYGCTNLTSITIPNSVTSIGHGAFGECKGLTSVTIGNGVKSISSGVFSECASLTSVTFGNSVKSIGDFAFRECASLRSITIPNSVDSIGGYAFYRCDSLTSVTIGNGVTSIGNDAFEGCSGLTSVTFGNNVTSIEGWAFQGTNLRSITLPNSVTWIGPGAFHGTDLRSVTIPNSVDSIGESAFGSCDSLTSVIWNAKNARTVPLHRKGYIFGYCPALSSLTIGEDVEEIEELIFPMPLDYGSIYDSDDDYGSPLTTVIWNAKNCTTCVPLPSNVEHITFGPGVESIPGDLCSRSSIEKVVIPNSVKTIGYEAFWNNHMSSVIIGSGVTEIGNRAFYGVSSITCYAPNPPVLDVIDNGWRPFDTDTMFVLAESLSAYKEAYKDSYPWDILLPIGATSVQTDDVHIATSDNYAEITWQAVANAAQYELWIEIMGVKVVWQITFDANGLLVSMVSRAPARDKTYHGTQSAGFSYTVIGLDSGTKYNATIIAKDKNGKTLDTKKTSFSTTGDAPSGIDNVDAEDAAPAQKILRDGQVLIQRAGKVYDLCGNQLQ
ncbi:MAG: leucine-rich repeat domain-containing protein [Paludibacteraceae bacterium]